VRDGDIIVIDIPARVLAVELSDETLAQRRVAWKPAQRDLHGWLKRYAAMVTSGSQGGAAMIMASERARLTVVLSCWRDGVNGDRT
jgi:dihydroxy-acid dehydratase